MLYMLLSICERDIEIKGFLTSLQTISERDIEIKGFLTSPQITQELVLLHLVHEIETWLYCVAWLPLEVTYKKYLG
jgi:hypothetical protein